MFNKICQQTILWSVISISPMTVLAVEQINSNEEKPKASKSISYQTNNALDDKMKKKLLSEAPKDISSSLLRQALTAPLKTAERHISVDYSLYDATTDLITDEDYDGYYHRFAVTIDVDTLFDHATIYADFYLSYEGGPWIYYASSDHYDIHSDHVDDKFTVETELADGYPTGYYDMRIKLYDSETDEYLLTYDNYDDGSLSAIPLEDSYRDEHAEYEEPYIETEVIVTHGAGSINLLSLLLLCALLVTRQIKNIFCKKQSIEV